MKSPRISVVMPVYNTERYLRQATESILNQTFRDFEFIIIDDCSTDSSPEIIQEYAGKDRRIRVLHNSRNLNNARARNRGIKVATGKYVAQMDSDDISLPNRLKKQFKFMEEHPEVVVSGGAVELIDENDRPLGVKRFPLSDQEIRKHIFRHNPLWHPLTIFRKDILDRVEGYDPNLAVAVDYELYFRMGQFGNFANLPEVMLRYRIHPANLTRKRRAEVKKRGLLIKKRAVGLYGYQMSLADKLLYFSQKIIPCSLRAFIFDLVRCLRSFLAM